MYKFVLYYNFNKGVDMEEKISSRRSFLKVAGFMAGAAAVAPAAMASSKNQANQSIFGEYARVKVTSLSNLKANGEVDFTYPDSNSMCKAVYVDNQVKAYSTVCTHKGCPTMYDKKTGVFECPCHHTKYDAAKDGQMIIGHATGGLPEVILEVSGDDIYAVGFEGLIFGRINNTRG